MAGEDARGDREPAAVVDLTAVIGQKSIGARSGQLRGRRPGADGAVVRNRALDRPSRRLTFGFTGLAVLLFASLMRASRAWPAGLAYLGFASGILLVVIYLARLTIVSPGNAVVLAPAALEGFLVGPVWYVWLGLELRDELITAATTGGTGP